MDLTARNRQELKGLGHRLSPVIQVGAKGVSDALVEELKSALLAHELVKVKVSGESRHDDADALAARADAELVQVIGRSVLLYRPHPERPRLLQPKAPSQKKTQPKKLRPKTRKQVIRR